MEYARRDVIDTVFCVLRTGCQWRQIPHDLVKWRVAYRWFRTLARDGTWQRVHGGLHARVRSDEGRAAEPAACALDSRSAQSPEGGEAISFGKFRHCRGRDRRLPVPVRGRVLLPAAQGPARRLVLTDAPLDRAQHPGTRVRLQVAHLMRHRARQAGLDLSVRELLGQLAGIQETVLIYPFAGGRPRARRMTTEHTGNQPRLYETFSLARWAPRS